MQFLAQLAVTGLQQDIVGPMQQQEQSSTAFNLQGAPTDRMSAAWQAGTALQVSACPTHAADHFWWTDDPFETATDFFQPNEFAPHCLPCHWTPDLKQQAVGDGEKYQPFTPYTGCPCTVEHICRHDTRKLYKEACDGPLDHLPFRSDTICLRQLHTSPVLQVCFGFDAGCSLPLCMAELTQAQVFLV